MTDTHTTLVTDRSLLGIKIACGGAMAVQLAELADGQSMLTYLNTTDPKIVPFYEKYGFQIISKTNSHGILNFHFVGESAKL